MIRALTTDPSLVLLDRALSGRAKWIPLRRIDIPTETVARRPRALASLTAVSDRLAPLRDAWRDRLPVDAPLATSIFL